MTEVTYFLLFLSNHTMWYYLYITLTKTIQNLRRNNPQGLGAIAISDNAKVLSPPLLLTTNISFIPKNFPHVHRSSLRVWMDCWYIYLLNCSKFTPKAPRRVTGTTTENSYVQSEPACLSKNCEINFRSSYVPHYLNTSAVRLQISGKLSFLFALNIYRQP